MEIAYMKNTSVQGFATVTAMAALFVLPLSAHANNAPEALYTSKCATCHAADGSGSAVGKKLGSHDFHSAEVQKQADVELSGIVAKGKNKMPSYQKTLKPDEITALVAYIRSLAPGK